MERVVTIVGGGLSGLSLGIGLQRKGISVILHEAGIYPRHRVCGEFICGTSPGTLRALGIRSLRRIKHRSTAWFFRAAESSRPNCRRAGISRFALMNGSQRNFAKLDCFASVEREAQPEGWPVCAPEKCRRKDTGSV
jgi:glycine/D-amino acid oxidase-like deaminating enzyme